MQNKRNENENTANVIPGIYSYIHLYSKFENIKVDNKS